MTWEKGRQLKSFDNNTYTYNANGIRNSKTVNGVLHNYTLDGTKILRETWGTNTLIPIYDSEDSVCGIIYNVTPHYFLKNLQGDIISIANARCEVEARYTYDAWGAITNISGTDEGISIAVVKAIDGSLDKAKNKKRDNRYERHRIVAQGSFNSDVIKSRTIIYGVGITVNSSHNLVDIKYNLHRHLHTNAYYKAVYNFLNKARGSYKKVVIVLNVIKKALQAASNACP